MEAAEFKSNRIFEILAKPEVILEFDVFCPFEKEATFCHLSQYALIPVHRYFEPIVAK